MGVLLKMAAWAALITLSLGLKIITKRIYS